MEKCYSLRAALAAGKAPLTGVGVNPLRFPVLLLSLSRYKRDSPSQSVTQSHSNVAHGGAAAAGREQGFSAHPASVGSIAAPCSTGRGVSASVQPLDASFLLIALNAARSVALDPVLRKLDTPAPRKPSE